MVNIYEEHNKIETTVSFGGGGVGDNNNATMDNPNCLSPSVGGYCIGANMNSPAEAGATGSFGIISATVPNSKYSLDFKFPFSYQATQVPFF